MVPCVAGLQPLQARRAVSSFECSSAFRSSFVGILRGVWVLQELGMTVWDDADDI